MANPISVEPSQGWDGNDGPWSTFVVRVGNPPQTLRVLASTTIPETWVVLPDGCTPQDGKNCPDARGNLFHQNISTTWENQGIYELSAERNLNFTDYDNGDYGHDTLGLGYNGSGGLSLDHQVVAGLATKDFYLGYFGLTPRPINFSLTESSPSYLSNLKNERKIPSLSFGYSAGAYYRLKKVDASLTLGGYDSSRFSPNNVSLDFATDVARDLVVGLQSIRFSDAKTANSELLSGGILAFVDATVPHIWLPISACEAFESAFGLSYDQRTALYLVNDSLHDQLLAQNASVTFILGNTIKDGETISITLPYLSFDLQASYEYLNQTTRYFPLRRADNDTQYTLGRTFLQESYLIVDYERETFSLSQSTFIENAKQNLVAILPRGNDTITRTSPNPVVSSHKLSGGALAGIVIAISTLFILVIGSIFFLIRRHRANAEKARSEEQQTTFEKPELHAEPKPNISELYNPQGEADSREVSKNVELDGNTVTGISEVEGSRGGVEMDGGSPAAVELDAGPLVPLGLRSPDTGAQESLSPVIGSEQQRLPSPAVAETSASVGRGMLGPRSRSEQLMVPGNERQRPVGLWSGRRRGVID